MKFEGKKEKERKGYSISEEETVGKGFVTD